jgi:hypothetical protein
MKNVNKILCVAVILAILCSFVGCSIIDAINGYINDQTPNENPGEAEKGKFYSNAVKELDKYEDFVQAWKILDENNKLRFFKNPFVVDDYIGDEYKVIYEFKQEGVHTYYPINFEDFFADKNDGLFYTRIFMLEKTLDECQHTKKEYDSILLSYHEELEIHPEDADYEKYIVYNSYPYVNVFGYEYVEIKDKSLITVEGGVNTSFDGGYEYVISYDGEQILGIHGCVSLESDFIDLIVNNLLPAVEN